ncbi:MAG: deoxynucleoside kinase [Armatimonadetes bacterium]|nr:deoxynucleoside kinase [Anaerolineae bacterium]
MTTTAARFIAVAGNIGAGKSTLTQMLAQPLGWTPFYEANEENPYLADFYSDMPRWGLHSQLFFLGKRLEHHRQLVDYPGSVVQDRTVYEDAEVFARNLYQQGTMTQRDYETYRRLYSAVRAFLPPPDLIIYLQASTPTLLRHIAQRGRGFEQSISPAYVEQLNGLYDAWIGDWTACPVLRVPMDSVDFAHSPEDYHSLLQQVQDALHLPQM